MATAAKAAPKPKTTPEDKAFWDQASLAALSGASSEVRLTASEIVQKAINCADKMLDARAERWAPPEPPEQVTVTLNPASDTVTSAAETSTFTVTVTGEGSWFPVADPDANFLDIVSPTTPQNVSGTVTYAVTANMGDTPRAGTIAVGDKTFLVTQAAMPA